ncbi:uncharacterized protein [Diabrotica undecimpunctata]|uniref:uncharacterized protein n=1 Tax=Diabrotica undecimpunctata TaxID=50387 RepID=UPI003B638D34
MPSRIITKWKITQANWDLFRITVNGKTNELLFNNDIDTDVKLLNNCLTESAEECIGKCAIDPSKKPVPWWNESCKIAVKQCKKALNKFRKTRTTTDLINFKKLRANSRRILKESKKSSWNQYVSSITKDTSPAQMWSKIRRMKGHNTSSKIAAISLQDHTVTDDQHSADIFASHFSDKSNIPNLSNNSDTNISSPKIFFNTSSLNLPFNLLELNEPISSLKNSAAGPDDIPSIFLKNLHPDTHLKLLELYNKIWSQNQFPTLWRQATTIPIKKNDSSPNLLKSYRPISLTCSLCKLLEKMVNKRLLWYLERNNILDPFQTGFRSNRSTIDNLVTLHTDIVNAFSNRSEVIAVTLDIQSAFDTIKQWNDSWKVYTFAHHEVDIKVSDSRSPTATIHVVRKY